MSASSSHLIQGDWRKYHEANNELLYVMEPVVESLIQLLVQSTLVYIVLGPSDSTKGIGGRNMPLLFHVPSLWHLLAPTGALIVMMVYYMTAFQYNHSFGFLKPMKVKVVK